MKLFATLLLLGLCIATFLWWRARAHWRARYIDAYPYQKYLDRYLAARRPELSEAQRKLVFGGLREYFQLCRQARGRRVAMPSRAAHDAWLEFILHTRRYRRFCARGFGRFLHHAPPETLRSPGIAQDDLKRAWRLSCRREGINPQAPRTLPLLFALDAMLGIDDGFRYQAGCLPAGPVDTGGACPLHAACGGVCAGSACRKAQ